MVWTHFTRANHAQNGLRYLAGIVLVPGGAKGKENKI